jgi:hypothetical protein
MGLVEQTFTDYSTACGELPQSFFQMLANSVVSHVDEQGHTHCYLNVLYATDNCSDMDSCFDCDHQGEDPETFLVNHLFALDECGRLGIKMLLNIGSRQ